MDINEIKSKITYLNQYSYDEVKKNTLMILNQIENSLNLRFPYTILLDSNIFIRIEDFIQSKNIVGYLSILIIIKLLEKTNIYFEYALLPSVFYEFIRKRKHDSFISHWNDYNNAKKLIENYLGIKLLSINISKYENSEKIINDIEHDYNLLLDIILEYSKFDWAYIVKKVKNIIKTTSFKFKILVTTISNEIKFDKKFLYLNQTGIEDFLFNYRLYYLHLREFKVTNIVYINKDFSIYKKILTLKNESHLKGFADVDLFLRTRVDTQFQAQLNDQLWHPFLCFTLDENLNKLLKQSAKMNISEKMMFGKDNCKDNRIKINRMDENIKRFDESDKRIMKFWKDISKTFNEIFNR